MNEMMTPGVTTANLHYWEGRFLQDGYTANQAETFVNYWQGRAQNPEGAYISWKKRLDARHYASNQVTPTPSEPLIRGQPTFTASTTGEDEATTKRRRWLQQLLQNWTTPEVSGIDVAKQMIFLFNRWLADPTQSQLSAAKAALIYDIQCAMLEFRYLDASDLMAINIRAKNDTKRDCP